MTGIPSEPASNGMAQTPAPPRLEIRGMTKSFSGVKALDSVGIEIAAGSIHALLGENGAGKSTLLKVITGVHEFERGTLRLDGVDTTFKTVGDAIGAGIAAVHQERNLVPRFSVAENILIEDPPRSFGFLRRGGMRREAAERLRLTGVDIDPDREVRRLSVGQMQIVEIAKAIGRDMRLLVMDEPTASLTPQETRHLFALLRKLAAQGTAVLFVSHKLEEVLELCDAVTVLRDGIVSCASRPVAGLDRGDLVRFMSGRAHSERVRIPRRIDARPLLELKGVSTDLGHRDIGLVIRAGEVVGLYGLVGAGRTELARAIIGAARITGGTLQIDGRTTRIPDVATALERHGIGYVSEDRKEEGLILAHSVQRNTAITVWRRIAGRLGGITSGCEWSAVSELIERLGIRTKSMSQPVGLLSGGNQQKVSVAKWLTANVRLLIFDEPSVGIDVTTKAQIYDLIDTMAETGAAVLLITSDMPEMLALADRVVVMGGYRIVGEVAATEDRVRTEAGIADLLFADRQDRMAADDSKPAGQEGEVT